MTYIAPDAQYHPCADDSDGVLVIRHTWDDDGFCVDCAAPCHHRDDEESVDGMTWTCGDCGRVESSTTLIELPDLIQGSDEWHDQRRGIVTASVVGRLLTASGKPANNDTSRTLTAQLVAERITGWTDPVFVSDDMLRGTDDEPRAVEVYAAHFAPVTATGFMVRVFEGFRIGYSPDGLVGDDGLIEVKSRRAKKQLQTILEDSVPAENMAQLQCGLLVSGRAWVDYVSYCGGMPLYVKRVEPDTEWFEAIIAAVTTFEATAAQMVADYTAATEGLPATERVIELEMVI